jgi:hypothetical protein
MWFVLTIVVSLAVPVGGVFGDATATAEVASEGRILVDFRIEGPADSAVVAHLIDPGDNQETVTLGSQTDGVFTGSIVVENANLVVVFEALTTNGASTLSEPTTLLDLGVDTVVLGYPDPAIVTDDSEPPLVSPENQRLLWAAGGAVAAALALVAFWAAGPKPKTTADEEE